MSQIYQASQSRYQDCPEGWFRRCGESGLVLPALSLGCWHNFGDAGTDTQQLDEVAFHMNAQKMLFTAFDHGIVHFDLANNYGPKPGQAEKRVGRIVLEDLKGYRDELIISTKAGYEMWPGPYGQGCSRKSLLSSLDQSLMRLGLDYVDIFYSHRFDPHTPLQETLYALDTAVRSGKALYVGISSYSGEMTLKCQEICEREGLITPIIHQPRYSMLDRHIETDLWPAIDQVGMGVIGFCPLAQGLLTDKYLKQIPEDSRAKNDRSAFLNQAQVTPELVLTLQKIHGIAQRRGQSLAQMALSWALRDSRMTSLLIGASRPSQIEENAKAAKQLTFTEQELIEIDARLA